MKATYFKMHKFLIWYLYVTDSNCYHIFFENPCYWTSDNKASHCTCISSMVVCKDLESYQIEFSFTTINLVFSLQLIILLYVLWRRYCWLTYIIPKNRSVCSIYNHHALINVSDAEIGNVYGTILGLSSATCWSQVTWR